MQDQTENISVDDAISKGRKEVFLPSTLTFLAIIILGLFSTIYFKLDRNLIFLYIVLAPIISTLIWANKVTKWRIWAFSNVRNVHELEKQAVKAGILYRSTWMEKLEIRNEMQKRVLKQLEEKFNYDDVFEDTQEIADTTYVYFDRLWNKLQLIADIVLLIASLVLFAMSNFESYVFILLTPVFIYLSYKNYKEYTNRDPQITFSKEGLQWQDSPFYKWDKIEDIEVGSTGGKHSTDYMRVYYKGGVEFIDIEEYDKTLWELEEIAKTYLGRAEHPFTVTIHSVESFISNDELIKIIKDEFHFGKKNTSKMVKKMKQGESKEFHFKEEENANEFLKSLVSIGVKGDLRVRG